MPEQISRRSFLRQSVAFSAAAAIAPLPTFGAVGAHGDAELLMVGDWGYHRPADQTIVAASMVQYARTNRVKSQALLMLGDNWYEELPGGVDSPRWKTGFEDMYPASVFPGPAYAVLGNHDYQMFPMSKVDVELEYARRGHSRWTMPAKWYSFDFPKKKPLIHFIALDSNMPHPIAPNRDGTPNRNFTLTEDERVAQLQWLEAELAKPRLTPFTIVMAHHPVYTDGPHGDHATLIRDWDPLFQKHGVHAYLAGHDHDLQHLEFEGHPTTHFLSGGGGADLYDLAIDPKARGPYAQKVYGFSHLSVTDKTLTLRHVDAQGRIIHALTKTPDGKMQILKSA
ncbi:putative phosphohydrolase [Terriglobus roseus DSM 18391]|uniref:Putative phosphohydrolase n=1 Tax=Terriglobus roseus (strain DSM 18391 / NRRL B-41598 / KBS 63) TaxID=926566 RepID=I3ZIN2_TERRK|nr:metallophosphoesterase [Terriglobus roseus]AFL89100.1 putative phosphohydrolase [Terriglobus roseus DSM 18391]